MLKHPFLHNPHKRKAQIRQMCKVLEERFEKLYRYYGVAKKRNESPETVYRMVENINALLTLLEKEEASLNTLPLESEEYRPRKSSL